MHQVISLVEIQLFNCCQFISKMKSLNSQNTGKAKRHSKLIWFFNVIFAIVVTHCLLYLVYSRQYSSIFLSDASLPQQIIKQFCILNSSILVIFVAMKEWMELVNNTNNNVYRCHSNIINHTILWTIILWGSILYDYEFIWETGIAIQLLDVHLLGRVLFCIGYLLGTILGYQSFRALGMGLIFGSVLAIFSEYSGHSMGKHFV